ncbi:YicC/YloC family endoribonuclease [Derxia gummosa]|uniref:YicC/YloC family endoribonuclease n=1 Tax=Derxia gummosa DSM 723 TaxID=1121388 RepID=A0A9U5CJQ8_9BURK|nr:YicC/YloC family endoribonuclease [Derxia gummosa]
MTFDNPKAGAACASMTGYAGATRSIAGANLSCELRSVNSRFLDLQFRIPDELRQVESVVREAIGATFQRGKIEFRLQWQRADDSASPASSPDPAAIRRLVAWQETVLTELPEARHLSVADVLRWPGIVAERTLAVDALRDAAITAARECVGGLRQARQREGERIAAHLRERLTRIEEVASSVSTRLPELREAHRAKVAARVDEVVAAASESSGVSRDELAGRIASEVTLFSLRADVDEELARLRMHCAEVRRLLDQPPAGGLGKRLDFLMQELNREANTLGSKAVAVDLANASIDLKLLIEQMREQVQNLE